MTILTGVGDQRWRAKDLATLDRLSATVIDGLHNPSH